MKGTDKHSDKKINEGIYERNADLGLFKQLLQMVDGNWSDSIQGICDHLHQHFRALGLTLSVFDSSFNEFIYVSQSIDNTIEKVMVDNNLSTKRKSIMEILTNLYQNHNNLLDEGTFEEKDVEAMALTIFRDLKKTKAILEFLKPLALTVIRSPVAHAQYRCYFHILSNRNLNEANKNVIDNYIPQLEIALEIVFLVRDLYIKATHDGLTKLFDHTQGLILINREMERVKRNKRSLTLALIMLDLDNFKIINDNYGHQEGDVVLQSIAKLLTDNVRRCDIVSRYGGEEFLIALPDTPIKTAKNVIKRLKGSLEKQVFSHEGNDFSVTASFGMAMYDPEKHNDSQSLIKSADIMLYRAKEKGKNRIEY